MLFEVITIRISYRSSIHLRLSSEEQRWAETLHCVRKSLNLLKTRNLNNSPLKKTEKVIKQLKESVRNSRHKGRGCNPNP